MSNVITERSFEQKQIRLQELRAELDALGYHVVRKDWVRKFGVVKAVVDQERFSPHWNNIKSHIQRHMGHELGNGIFDSGAVKVSEETSGFNGGFCLRAEVSIILRDPQFDMPTWANPEYHK